MNFRHERSQSLATFGTGDLQVPLRVHHVELPAYSGPAPQSAWRKPVVGPPSRPFAELQVVDGLEADGWTAAWVHRPGTFLATWEPRVPAHVPVEAVALHLRIGMEAAAKAGAWDVFAWRDGVPLFIELKRAGSSDRIRRSQLLWRLAALRAWVAEEAFAFVEWSGEGRMRWRTLQIQAGD